MAKVLGLGGLFFKTRDGAALHEWYSRVLGIEFADWGGVFFSAAALALAPGAGTVWNGMSADTDYFDPSEKDFMFNFVVDDLDGILERCKQHGVEPVKLFPSDPAGRFAHIIDLEGRKIELWEPKPLEN